VARRHEQFDGHTSDIAGPAGDKHVHDRISLDGERKNCKGKSNR
jgi:hypothetical protein